MRIMILGSSSFIGYHLLEKLAKKNHAIIATYKSHLVTVPKKVVLVQADILSSALLQKLLEENNPQVIINCVGLSDIDTCEKMPQLCEKINLGPTKTIVSYCKKNPQCQYLFFSSSQIFDGKKNVPYTEKEAGNPLSHYGRCKWQAEQLITSSLKNYAIVRPCVVYGWPLSFQHRNLLTSIHDRLSDKKRFSAYMDMMRNPVSVEDVTTLVEKVVAKKAKGIFHAGSPDALSITDFALAVARAFQLPEKLIQPLKSSQEQAALRPKYNVLDCSFTQKSLSLRFRSVQTSLELLAKKKSSGGKG